MNLLKRIQSFFKPISFDEMPAHEVLGHFTTIFQQKIDQVTQEMSFVMKSLAFQKREFLILLDKAQFDQQLKALLPYAVKLKKDGQYIQEGKRMIAACEQVCQEIDAFLQTEEKSNTALHAELLKANPAYAKLFDKATRYQELTTQHQQQLYGDEKLIKKDLVKRATELIENPPFKPTSAEAFMQQKKQWIRDEVASILAGVKDVEE